MGEAKRRLAAVAPGPVVLELFAPDYKIPKDQYQDGPEKITLRQAKVRVSATLLQTAVNIKYGGQMGGGQMDGRDSRVWGRILEQLQEKPDSLTLIESDFQWLWKVYSDEGLRMPANLAHWRCDLEDYLSEIRDGLRKRETATA